MANKLDGLSPRYDLVVAGAGPAGSATAITAARTGLSVLQVDAKKFPRHKVCGGCLNPATLNLLTPLIGDRQRWNFESETLLSFHLFHLGREFPAVAPLGVAVNRQQLDSALVSAGKESGVVFRDAVRATIGPVTGDVRMVRLASGGRSVEIAANAVVMATGLGSSSCNNATEFARTCTTDSRVGIETIADHSGGTVARGQLLMAIGRFGYVGMTMIPGERLHIAASVDALRLRDQGPEALVREIVAQSGCGDLPGLRTGSRWRGTPPLNSRTTSLASNRVFVTGDAASYVEPFTGEGIRWALESGVGVVPLVRQAAAGWTDSIGREWADWYRQNIEVRQRLCRKLAAGLKRPVIRWMAHQAIAFHPRMVRDFISTIQG